MNPYLSFSIAMCLIVLLALACTAYMAIYFNRRAKGDLQAALGPLQAVVEGDVDLDEASVGGRYQSHLARGNVATLPGGMGRVFQTQIIDGAGGAGWSATVSRPKDGIGAPTVAIEPVGTSLDLGVQSVLDRLIDDAALAGLWFRLEYDPAAGYVRLTRPMRTRREIPSDATFSRWLAALKEVADANRASVEGGSDA